MKRLFLLRHAKAVPAEDSTEDFARELAGSGHKDANRLGKWLAAQNLFPGLVLCSPARRAVETWLDVAASLAEEPRIEFADALYLASPKTILALIRKTVGRSAGLMIVGHNPGLESLSLQLVRKPQLDEERERTRKLAHGLPTCALAILQFGAWSELEPHRGELTHLVTPKDTSG